MSYQKEYRLNHKDKVKKNNSIYRKNHEQELKNKEKEYYTKNRKSILLRNKNYALKNQSKISKTRREYNLKNRAKIIERQSKYQIKHRDKITEQKRRYAMIKRKKDLRYSLNVNLHTMLRIKLNELTKYGKISHSNYYGIKFAPAVEYLYRLFPQNRSEYHIDHIIPCKILRETKEKDLRKVTQLLFDKDNLRWLSSKENLSKHSKIPSYHSLPAHTKRIYRELKQMGYIPDHT